MKDAKQEEEPEESAVEAMLERPVESRQSSRRGRRGLLDWEEREQGAIERGRRSARMLGRGHHSGC